MRERPILFSSPMVRAILAGTKTQTRRVVKHKIIGPNQPTGIFDWHHPRTDEWMGAHGGGIKFGLTNAARLCPYGHPVDRLWVREAWAKTNCLGHEMFVYRVNDNRTDYGGPWKPSIHMPRWASRILLEIVGVRVERLQDISEADAGAEGIQEIVDAGVGHDGTPRDAYRALWEHINGPGSWAANPWVWVIEFKRAMP